MITPHINASKGDFSDVVLMSGDPLRVTYIAKKFLKKVKEVTNIRGMLGFTGYYKNRKISVMGHGIGIPSCSIYVKELIVNFGVKAIIRVGSCGAISLNIKLRDIVIGMGACTDSKVNRIKFCDNDFAAIADYNLINNAVSIAKKENINVHIGNIFSTDLFYMPEKKMLTIMEKYGILAVEMEAAGIYSVAAEHKIKALAICTVSDHFYSKKRITPQERETTFNDMIEIALESILLLK